MLPYNVSLRFLKSAPITLQINSSQTSVELH